MIVLHPFSLFRPSEQTETLAAIKKIRAAGFKVKNCLCTDKQDYDDFLLRYWDTDDLVTVEQDIVPSVEMLQSLSECKESWCTFEYFVRYKDNHCPAYSVFYGLGLTKFSLKAQDIASSERWYKHADWNYFNLDCRIANLLVQAKMSPHIHGQVKHNRVVDWTGATK